MLRNRAEDERLNLSRRSFFFFGAILAAKPDVAVPEPIIHTTKRVKIASVSVNLAGAIPEQQFFVEFLGDSRNILRAVGPIGGVVRVPLDSQVIRYGLLSSATLEPSAVTLRVIRE